MLGANVEEIFFAALEFSDPAARTSFLDRACGEPELRRRVERLLARDAQASGFLEACPHLPTALEAMPADGLAAEAPGTVIGPYRLMEQVGEGGMGVVYVAEQVRPVRRKVALKIIKPGMGTRQVVARFELERQALAMMDHPNIAKVFDGGATGSGRPYFVMELVRGVPITEYCDEQRLPLSERLELFVQVCRAVQHAHQKGVIHRDLKPSNILVTRHDGEPVPKVIDFGIAKATGQCFTDETVYTAFMQLVGTPLYMSPEQVELSSLDVDTRSDVYSLGVLLYELLTGTTPFDSEALRAAAFDEMRRIIREVEPPSPSTRLNTLGATLSATSAKRASDPRRLDRSVRGELDWVTMKALEKDRRRRYETANDLAADVLRFMTDQPVSACPPSASYRVRKFVRRNRALLVTVSLVAASLLGGTAVSIWQAVRAVRAERRADRQRELAERSAQEAVRQRDDARRQELAVVAREASLRRHYYAVDMKLAWQAWNHARSPDDLLQIRSLLARYEPDPAREDVRSFAWHHLRGRCGRPPRATLKGHKGRVFHVALSPDGMTLASAGEDGTAILWDLASARMQRTLRGHVGDVNCVAFAPDGREMATASDDRTVRFWDPASGREKSERRLTGFVLPVGRLEYSADGMLLVTGELSARGDGAASTLWDRSSQRRIRLEGHFPLALSPDSKRLATSDAHGDVRLWDVADGRERAVLRGHDGIVPAAAFSPDGASLATGSNDQNIRIWSENRVVRILRHGLGSLHSLAYSPDGKRLAAVGDRDAVFVWETGEGRIEAAFSGHSQRVRAVRFTPDGRTLATASDDGTIKLRDTPNASIAVQLPDEPGPFTDLTFTPDGEQIAATVARQHTRIWTVRTGEGRPWTLASPDREVTGVATSHAGRLMAVSWTYESVSVIDPITSIERWTNRQLSTHIKALAFSPDGWRLVGGGDDHVIHVWDARTGERLRVLRQTGHDPAPQSLAISPDGKTLAIRTGGPVTWDLETGLPSELAIRPKGSITCLAYSPDGRTLATASEEVPWIQLWDTSNGRERAAASGGSNRVRCLAFSPDGRTLAIGDEGGDLRLLDVATSQELAELVGHTGPIVFASFSPDGRTLATAGSSADKLRRELRFWHAEDDAPGPHSRDDAAGQRRRIPDH